MAVDLHECIEHPPTPERLRRVAEALSMGRCPVEARRRTRSSGEEYLALIQTVVSLRAGEEKPTIRQIADVTGYSKSTIGRIVAEFGL